MLDLLERLESTGFASIARESLYGFQILVGIHIVGLIFSVGTLVWVDLRMLGVCLTGRPLSAVYRSLSKVFVAGFAVMFGSGAALFAGFATSAYENTFFRVKMLLIVLAGLNALAFHGVLSRQPDDTPGRLVKAAGFVSLAAWAGVVLCGRLIAYSLF